MLPYIATPARLLAAEEKGQLARWRPPDDQDIRFAREIWMPPALIAAINADPWPTTGNETEQRTARRRKETLAFMTSFLRGDVMTVGTGNERVDIKAMDPQQGLPWRAWELRVTVADPHTRIFGVFASYQDFVAKSVAGKSRMTPASQTNLANTAFNSLVPILGQTILTSTSRPSASTLGGEDLNYEQSDL